MQWSRDSHAHRFSDTCWPCTPVGPETQVHRPLGRDSLRKCIGTKAYGSTQTFAHTSLGMLKWTCQIGKGRHVCTGRNAQTSVRARMYEAPQGKTYPNTRVPPLEKVFFFFFSTEKMQKWIPKHGGIPALMPVGARRPRSEVPRGSHSW